MLGASCRHVRCASAAVIFLVANLPAIDSASEHAELCTFGAGVGGGVDSAATACTMNTKPMTINILDNTMRLPIKVAAT